MPELLALAKQITAIPKGHDDASDCLINVAETYVWAFRGRFSNGQK